MDAFIDVVVGSGGAERVRRWDGGGRWHGDGRVDWLQGDQGPSVASLGMGFVGSLVRVRKGGSWVRGRVGLVAEVVVGGRKSRDGVGVLWRFVDVWAGCQGSANIHQKGKSSANIHQT